MANFIGKMLGRYQITAQLGEGGMATVYKAHDSHLDRDVAIKVIRSSAFSPEVLERVLKRFEREAKALARLTHPNIVPIIDYGAQDGSPYLVMPFLPGGTLKQRMGQPLPFAQAALFLKPIADALAFAHEESIVHRDVKPGNILLTAKGQPMLSDFGIARLLENEDGSTLTGAGMGVGTPEYMAPEQGMGYEIDARADIYALGVVLYELIAGRKPFTADTPMAVVVKHLNEPLPRISLIIPNLPAQVEEVLDKAMAKLPADRFQSMAEFADVLAGLGGIAGSAPAASAFSSVLPQDEPTWEGEMTGEVTSDAGTPTPELAGWNNLQPAQAGDATADLPAQPPAALVVPEPSSLPEAVAVPPQKPIVIEPKKPRRTKGWVLVMIGILALLCLIVIFSTLLNGLVNPASPAFEPAAAENSQALVQEPDAAPAQPAAANGNSGVTATRVPTNRPPASAGSSNSGSSVITAQVVSDFVYLRAGPDMSHPTISNYLPVSSRVSVLSKTSTNTWFYVRTDDQMQGWLYREWISLDTNADAVPVAKMIPTVVPPEPTQQQYP